MPTQLVVAALALATIGVAGPAHHARAPHHPRNHQGDVLKFNPHSREWSYEAPDSRLQYIPQEDRWEYSRPGEHPRYNPMQDRWENAR